MGRGTLRCHPRDPESIKDELLLCVCNLLLIYVTNFAVSFLDEIEQVVLCETFTDDNKSYFDYQCLLLSSLLEMIIDVESFATGSAVPPLY